MTKEEALNYYRTQVIPALDAGYDHPTDYLRALEQERKIKSLTVRDWFTEYLTTYTGHMKESTRNNLASVLNRAADSFGEETFLSSVSTKDIAAFVSKQIGDEKNKKDPSPDTRRNRLLMVRRAFEKAVKAGFLPVNPCEPLELPKAIGNRIRFFDMEEVDKLMKKLGGYEPRDVYDPTPEILQAMVIVALYTGFRRGEIFVLEWADFQIDELKNDYRVHVHAKSKWAWSPKNNIGRIVGFNPIVWQYLCRMRDSRAERLKKYRERLRELMAWKEDRENGSIPEVVPNVFADFKQRPSVQRLIGNTRSVIAILERQSESSLVFPGTMGERLTELPKAFDNALVELGMKDQPDTSFHALRHSFASHLVMAGVDLPTVKDLMGHADIKTTMRYAHLAPAHRSAAGAKMPTLKPESGRAKEGRSDGANVIDMTGTS